MRRLSPTSRWVVLPTVAVTTTFVVAVASATARPDDPAPAGAGTAAAAAGPDRAAAEGDRGDGAIGSVGEPARKLWPTSPSSRKKRPPIGRPGRPNPTASPTASPTATAPRPTSTPTTPPAPAPTTAQPGGGSYATQVVTLTNAERAKAGCGALTVDATLTSVAQAHSQDMAAKNYFSHDSQDGRSPFDRITAAGYRYSTAAENIAAGQRTPQDVVTGWMNSEGHRANILNCALKQIGVGYATASGSTYGSYWTQDFGTPR